LIIGKRDTSYSFSEIASKWTVYRQGSWHTMMLTYFTLYLLVALLSSTLAIGLAHSKHRTWMLWGIMSLFFPPMVILLLIMPKRKGPAPFEEESVDGEHDDPNKDEGWFYW